MLLQNCARLEEGACVLLCVPTLAAGKHLFERVSSILTGATRVHQDGMTMTHLFSNGRLRLATPETLMQATLGDEFQYVFVDDYRLTVEEQRQTALVTRRTPAAIKNDV